jgi:hypothetical protein
MPTDRTLQQMIEILVTGSDLTGYFHPEERPERVPITVAIDRPERFDSSSPAFGSPIEFVSGATENEAALEVTVGLVEGRGTSLRFSYPPEGVAGEALFSSADPPELISLSIVER